MTAQPTEIGGCPMCGGIRYAGLTHHCTTAGAWVGNKSGVAVPRAAPVPANEGQPSAFMQAWDKAIEREQRLRSRAEKAEAALAYAVDGLQEERAVRAVLETALREIADDDYMTGRMAIRIAREALASVADR